METVLVEYSIRACAVICTLCSAALSLISVAVSDYGFAFLFAVTAFLCLLRVVEPRP